MKNFMCPACGRKLSPLTIYKRYEAEDGAFTCPQCNTRARLRHFTKGVTIKQISSYRNKIILIWSIVSIPIQVFIYVKFLTLILGG